MRERLIDCGEQYEIFDMAELLAQQLSIQRLIEKALDNFKKIGKNNLTPAKVRSRIQSLKDKWMQMLGGHAALMKVIPEASRATIDYFKEDGLATTEEHYQSALDYMSECLEELEPPVSPNTTLDVSQFRASSSAFSLSHLPPIQLPPFDGNVNDWEQFRNRFTTFIIENKNLNNFAKMHFLTSCVRGRALESIGKIVVTADNFEIAWRKLTSRFENKRKLVNLHLSTLLGLPVMSRESASELQTLQDQVDVAISSLEKLQRSPEEMWHDMLIHIIVHKLDPTTRKAWKLKSNESREPPSFEELISFIESRTRELDDYSTTLPGKSTTKPAFSSKIHVANSYASTAVESSPKVSIATVAASTSTASVLKTKTATASTPCPLCKESHYFSICPQFVRGNPTERRALAKQHRRCFNCLSQNHSVNACKSKYSCRICNRKHHTMLHVNSDSSAFCSTASAPSCQPSLPSESNSEVISLLASTSRLPRVLLATALVVVRVESGVVRALLDQGSEITIITESLAQLLQMKRVKMSVSISAVGCISADFYRYAAQISISPRDSFTPFSTTALILKNLTSYTPKDLSEVSRFPHLVNLPLADPGTNNSDPISIIIGADLYSDVILNGLRRGSSGEPIAQTSIFGWVISGSSRSSSHKSFASSCHSTIL